MYNKSEILKSRFYRKMKKNRQNNSGYTLVEMLVSVFVITLLTGMFVVNYHGASNSSRLSLAAQEMASNIRTAQNNSLGLVKYGDILPAGGWGFYLDKAANQYYIFGDLDGNETYDNGENDKANGAKIVTLPSGVVVDSITENSSSVNSINIAFLPPDPKVFMSGVEGGLAQIVLRDTDTQTIKKIEVNFFGLIEVK
jgi:type II secretory pathway pseudopilin PulG